MALDLIVEGGTVVTASEVMHFDLGISGGKIVALGAALGNAE